MTNFTTTLLLEILSRRTKTQTRKLSPGKESARFWELVTDSKANTSTVTKHVALSRSLTMGVVLKTLWYLELQKS